MFVSFINPSVSYSHLIEISSVTPVVLVSFHLKTHTIALRHNVKFTLDMHHGLLYFAQFYVIPPVVKLKLASVAVVHSI